MCLLTCHLVSQLQCQEPAFRGTVYLFPWMRLHKNFNCRYGHCVPFWKYEKESFCDEFYTPGVDYIYFPNTRIGGQYSEVMQIIVNYILNLVLDSLEKCHDVARQAICHYYLPPCGNSSVFELPTSVCMETCKILQETCGEEFEIVNATFQQNSIVIEVGIDFIDCEDPGKPLSPLPYNCTRLEYEGSL